MASHGIRKDLNTHFHGIGLHDHHRCGTGWTADCLCVLLEHQTVLGTELRAVCRLRGVGAEGSAREHHHNVGTDVVCIEHHIDPRRVVTEGVVEIRAQGPEAGFAGTAAMTHQLQAAVGRNQAAVQQLNHQLTSAVAEAPMTAMRKGVCWDCSHDPSTPDRCCFDGCRTTIRAIPGPLAAGLGRRLDLLHRASGLARSHALF